MHASLSYASVALLDRSSGIFQSFFMGGFECATHRRRDRARLDVVSSTGHDRNCAEDYRLLGQAGIRTVRDGLRWHLIEANPYVYDWSSFLPMLSAALSTGTQVVWDLCHWGVPDGLDIFAQEFCLRFGAFAGQAAALIRQRCEAAGVQTPRVYCPINEISFWAWVGGDVEHFHPYGRGRAAELKRQLVRASLAATQAIHTADPSARLLQAEPFIHISAHPEKPDQVEEAARLTASQFEAWDMLSGRRDSELGGSENSLDLLGVNFYRNNQWIHMGERTPPGHEQHRPLHEKLANLWLRYGRPIVITETGAEAAAAYGWLGYVCAEARQAIRMGVPVLGICLYPAMDYPGWDDERHCECGLIELDQEWSQRTLRGDLVRELECQQRCFV